jgi:TldD protein
MTHLSITDDLFYVKAGLDQTRTEGLVREALHGADDGELYLEYSETEALVWDDGRIKSATFDSSQGFGLRAVADEATGYAHAASLDEQAIKRAIPTVRAVLGGHTGVSGAGPIGTNRQLYTPENPLQAHDVAEKTKFLAALDSYARAQDPRVRQVSASLVAEWQAVQIVRADGQRIADVRPLVRLSVQVIVGEGDKQETGTWSGGGRVPLTKYLDPDTWHKSVDEAVRQALVNLNAVSAPAGEMTVVLGNGWPGILLHEAIGHGLEGDFNRKKTSAFAGLMGQRIAAKGVTVVDDGTLPDRRGSLTVDDEGTPTNCTTLIEDGILVGFMQDRLNARLMGMKATGNGRRQSFAHCPMPRMTNTVMTSGSHTKDEIIASVKKGVYAPNFGGGQVDITNGKFVFAASEAYLIEDGKLGPAIKGATLIGNGPDALTRVSMVGNDSKMDPGTGVCGKAGQGVPVGVGQPTLRIDGLTVGGTAA